MVKENPTWCIALHILTQYLMLCNYFWMFCEGVHLHLVLVVVFIKDNVAMRIFIFIGWIMPMIYVAVYSYLRKSKNGENQLYVLRASWIYDFYKLFSRCWIEESNYNWIMTVPVMILLLCSMIFLINIVRVLITKLHPKSMSPAPLAIKKAVRATLILVSVMGLHFRLFFLFSLSSRFHSSGCSMFCCLFGPPEILPSSFPISYCLQFL